MYASLFALQAMGDVLRYALWMTLTGFVAAGACVGGGHGVCSAWTRVGPPAGRRRRRAEFALSCEAARGIIEIEAFLAAQCAPGPPEQRPRSGGDA